MATVEWHGAALKAKIDQARNQAAYDAAEMVGGKADNIIPWATGSLDAAKFIQETGRGTAYIGYSAPYAAYQHDEILRHPDPLNPLSLEGREDHYLEKPLLNSQKEIEAIYAAKVGAAMR